LASTLAGDHPFAKRLQICSLMVRQSIALTGLNEARNVSAPTSRANDWPGLVARAE
jgi:hypothetical protein